MKRQAELKMLLVFALFVIVFGSNESVGYPIADSLQFPIDNYLSKKGGNYFGRKDYVTVGKWHLGDDVSASAGTNIYAMGAGIVRHAKYHAPSTDSNGVYRKNYGGMYIIEHNFNGVKVCALYVHMNFATFTKRVVGDEVAKNDYLGQVGNQQQNGDWGEHFHFGIRKGEYPANPNEYVFGDWIFSGYTANASVLKDWYDPTDFITDYHATSSISKYSNGTISQPILDRYYQSLAAGHPLGRPRDNNGGSIYVHPWNGGVTLQDFFGDNTGYYHGYTSIIASLDQKNAYLLKEGFWHQYMNNNGTLNYGAARTDEVSNWTDTTGTYGSAGTKYQSVQEFDKIVMLWDGVMLSVQQRNPDVSIAPDFVASGGQDPNQPENPAPDPIPNPPTGNTCGNNPDPAQPGHPMYAYMESGATAIDTIDFSLFSA